MISAAQAARFRQAGTRAIEEAFPTTIRIGTGAEIAAARWSNSVGGAMELPGVLATYDTAFRVRRELIVGGVAAIHPERTRITEDGKVFRVERVREAKGDDAVVLECKAV